MKYQESSSVSTINDTNDVSTTVKDSGTVIWQWSILKFM